MCKTCLSLFKSKKCWQNLILRIYQHNWFNLKTTLQQTCMQNLLIIKGEQARFISNLKFCLYLSSVKRFFFNMIANQLVYSIMITIVIVATVHGNCPEDKKAYPIVTITITQASMLHQVWICKTAAQFPSNTNGFAESHKKLILNEAGNQFSYYNLL